MKDKIKDEQLLEVSMKIILHSGDAKNFCAESLKEAKGFNFDSAYELLEKANENVSLAHKAQTEIIQEEARGNTINPSLLFAHAQDTLMTTMTEVRIVKEMIEFGEIIIKNK